MLHKFKIPQKVKISKSVLFWTVIIHPFLKPNGISSINSNLNMLYDISILISFLILIVFHVVKKENIDKNIIILSVFIGWITLITVFNNGQTLTLFRMFLQYVGLALVAKQLSSKTELLIRSMFLNLELLIYLNFILLLCYPQGMYVAKQNGNWNNWLLGYDNHWFIVYFGAMFVALAYLFNTKKALRSLALITTMHISAVIVTSGVIILGLAIIDIIVITKLYQMESFSYRNVWIMALIANIIIVFFSTSKISMFIVYRIFNKTDSSIPARLKIWSATFDAIKRNLLLGYGRQQTILRTTMYHNNHASNAHNFLIEIIYEGGIIGIGLFSILNIVIGKKINTLKKSDTQQLLLVCILACLVTGSVDSLLESRGALFFWMLSVAYYVGGNTRI